MRKAYRLSIAAALTLPTALGAPLSARLPAESTMATESPEDYRVALIGYRLSVAGRARCPVLSPGSGLVLRHLAQFDLADRPALIARDRLDLGPAVLVVVPGSPAAAAGIRPGDILLSIDGVPVPPDTRSETAFDQRYAQARSDRIDDLLESAGRSGPVALRLARDGRTVEATFVPTQVCPSHIHLARSRQRNAFADGRHVFLTTRLTALARTDDQLAFVIAHEMAHNILNHAATTQAQGARRGLLRGVGRSGGVVRQSERDADMLGADLVQDAGYDLADAAGFLRVVDRGGLRIGLFSTHDSVDDRIEAILDRRSRP